MQDKIEQAMRQAAEARERASRSSDPQVREEWLRVGRMWDDLALQYAEFAKSLRGLGTPGGR